MCVSGAGRGRMALIWLAVVILELSSRSRPPAERGSAPVEQGREGGRLAGPLRARDLGLWGEMGLKVWCYNTGKREHADKAGVWSCLSHFRLSTYLSLSLYESVFSLFDKHTHWGEMTTELPYAEKDTRGSVYTYSTWVLLKLWAPLCGRNLFLFFFFFWRLH